MPKIKTEQRRTAVSPKGKSQNRRTCDAKNQNRAAVNRSVTSKARAAAPPKINDNGGCFCNPKPLQGTGFQPTSFSGRVVTFGVGSSVPSDHRNSPAYVNPARNDPLLVRRITDVIAAV
jgi:hypothetical protein